MTVASLLLFIGGYAWVVILGAIPAFIIRWMFVEGMIEGGSICLGFAVAAGVASLPFISNSISSAGEYSKLQDPLFRYWFYSVVIVLFFDIGFLIGGTIYFLLFDVSQNTDPSGAKKAFFESFQFILPLVLVTSMIIAMV
ncbi:MAG: hypothetical protein WBB28_20130 [Crinalium sp.]